jgi:periplasmic glucans biosynthesis protein
MTTGKAHVFNYRLSWPDSPPRSWAGAYVRATRSGLINGPQRKSGALQFAIDFEALPVNPTSELPLARVEATSGTVSAAVVQWNPDTSGWRVSFSFDPKGAASSELRLALLATDTAVSDTWLYRWTKD